MTNDETWLSSAQLKRITEPGRLRLLRELQLSDASDDADLDRLSRLAAGLAGVPFAAISVVGDQREWPAGRHGFDRRALPHGLASYLVAEAQSPYLIAAETDPSLAGMARDFGQALQFGVGVPVVVGGVRIGALVLFDHAARGGLDDRLLLQLTEHACMAAALIELKREARVRAATAAELIREEWRHALTLEAGQVGSWVWDVPTGAITGNDILRRLFRLQPLVPIKIEELFAAISPDDLPRVEDGIARTFEEGVDFAAEYRVTGGRWLSSRGRVYQRNAQDRPLVMMGITIDITEAREAADRTRRLLLELNHRVKNTLAMTQSIARQTLRQNADPQVFIEAFSGRLRTLADAHDLLADRDWAGIGLVELVQSQVAPYAPTGGERLKIEGEDLQLPPDHALGLGLVLHELASNALRHGALSPLSQGQVRLVWRVEANVLRLSWTETGGPAIAAPPVLGFGSRLIERSLDKVIGSSVHYAIGPEGVLAEITLPVADQSSL